MWWNLIDHTRTCEFYVFTRAKRWRGKMEEGDIRHCNRSQLHGKLHHGHQTLIPLTVVAVMRFLRFHLASYGKQSTYTVLCSLFTVFCFSTFAFLSLSFVSFDVLKQNKKKRCAVYLLMNNWRNENDKWHVLYQMISKLKQKWFINAWFRHHWQSCSIRHFFECFQMVWLKKVPSEENAKENWVVAKNNRKKNWWICLIFILIHSISIAWIQFVRVALLCV